MRGRIILLSLVIILVLLLCSPLCFSRKVHSHSKKRSHKHSHAKKPGFVKQPVTSDTQQVLNVEDFGAKADETSDNYQAFKKAWDKACSSLVSVNILVPKDKTYYVKHINFTGPCKSSMSMEIQGTIKSLPEMYDLPRKLWIKFEDVRNMEISGGGTIDGNGDIWWKNSCKIKKTKPCQSQSAPTALTFNNCSNLRLSNLKLTNAQQMHLNFQDSHDIEASMLSILAPETSPNTDGIHVTRTVNLRILDSQIRTGDDCISIVNGSRNVEVRNIVCGPGHGISIGSLGEDNSENHVSDIFVKGVKLSGTTNGVRIKTWQGGSGTARNIEFEDIDMRDVSNPIIINQYYCDKNKRCDKEKSAVQIENVVYRNIRGTSASKTAINFNCSDTVPCRNLMMENVMLTASNAKSGERVEAFCSQRAMQNLKMTSVPSC